MDFKLDYFQECFPTDFRLDYFPLNKFVENAVYEGNKLKPYWQVLYIEYDLHASDISQVSYRKTLQ